MAQEAELEMRQRLEQRIVQSSEVRESEGLASSESASSGYRASSSFAAALVLKEGAFELWLGSLEDALSLEQLAERRVDALLNCALDECRVESACERGPRGAGRRRSHARGPSLWEEREGDGVRGLDRDQIKALANFDADWYSAGLGYDVTFLGVAARDEDGYPLDTHYAEMSAFLQRCRADGRKVLVHCIMGINRSAAAVVAFLCLGLGKPLEDAIDLVARRRGPVLSNVTFLGQLVRHFGPGAVGGAGALRAAPAAPAAAEELEATGTREGDVAPRPVAAACTAVAIAVADDLTPKAFHFAATNIPSEASFASSSSGFSEHDDYAACFEAPRASC